MQIFPNGAPRIARVVSLFAAFSSLLSAQSVTGQVSGAVTDASGAVVVDADVTLTHTDSKQQRIFKTDTSGNFIFTGIIPGEYGVRIAQSGFQTYEQKGLRVNTQERVESA